jgi:hypothetical protein
MTVTQENAPMSKQDDIRAQIIAAQAARQALNPPAISTKARRNWAASAPVPPKRQVGRPKK